MKIVLAAHAFPPYTGGLSYVVEHLSVNLAKMGFEVEVLTLDIDGGLPSYEEYNGVNVRRFRGYAPDNCYFIPSLEYIEYLKKVKADVVHVHNIGSLLTPITTAVVSENSDKTKIVVTPHHHEGGSKWHTKIGWLFYKPIARHALLKANVIHAVSDYEASLIKRDFGLEAVVIPNGINEDVLRYRWDPPKDRIVITYAGRVEKYKRLDLVLKVAAELSKSNLETTLRVIGEGSDLQRIVKAAKNAGVNLETPGFLSRLKYLEALSESTVFINLSDYEAYSIVTAEALAMGVPAIVAKPWGRIFEDKGAYVVDKHDTHGIAKLIMKIYNHEIAFRGNNPSNDMHKGIMPWPQVVKQIVEKVYL
jgi:glycosyltransferase involved in cell wall biosynthesis